MYSQLTGVLIPCARPLSFKQSISVIERNRAPTGTNRPFRSRFGAVLDARVILNAGGLHFPILLSSPTNSPHRAPGTAFLSRIARGSITQGIFCDPQLEMSRVASSMHPPIYQDFNSRGGPRYENGKVDAGLPDRPLGERGCASAGCVTQAAKRSSGSERETLDTPV